MHTNVTQHLMRFVKAVSRSLEINGLGANVGYHAEKRPNLSATGVNICQHCGALGHFGDLTH